LICRPLPHSRRGDCCGPSDSPNEALLVRSQCSHRMVESSWELINFADRQSAKLEHGRNHLSGLGQLPNWLKRGRKDKHDRRHFRGLAGSRAP
jgi:hypothetical protein